MDGAGSRAFFSEADPPSTLCGCCGWGSSLPDEETMPRPSRWTAEKRYAIVLEMLRGEESIAQIARTHKVSDALLHRWRERFFEGVKAALWHSRT